MRITHTKSWLYGEFALFTFGVPLALALLLPGKAILPVIWGMTLICYHIARVVRHEDDAGLWDTSAVTRANLRPIMQRFLLCAALLIAATLLLSPDTLFDFPKRNPAFWMLIMVLYPLLSVIPQEIIFRTYLFARFKKLFGPNLMVAMSAIGFGFAHIIFHNWQAPALCAIGGWMFALTYRKHQSLLLVAIEHAMYGDFIFTLGLGRYFYHGAVHIAPKSAVSDALQHVILGNC